MFAKNHQRAYHFLFNSGFILIMSLALLTFAACGKQTVPASDPGYSADPQGTYSPPPSDAGTGASVPATSSGAQDTPPRGTKPYTVMGKDYHPLLTADGFSEEGIASWYGKDFHGKQTASGERYDMYGMTAAHKLLPFGTMVRVTHLQNGKSIVVRINDRGPFVDNRIIDLTHTAASQLDMLATGTAPVRLTTVGAVPRLEQGRLSGNFYVQIGAFSVENNAVKLVQSMRARGHSARSVFASSIGFWRVQIGPFPDLAQAESISESFKPEFERNFVIAD